MTLQQPQKREAIDPYRIFFPLGCVLAAWGIALWLAYAWQWVPYPGTLHADLMIGGFLLAFTDGFLLTAVPRFTGTPHATRGEILLVGWPLAVEVFAVGGVFGRRWEPAVAHASIALGLAFLASRLAQRYLTRQQEPPPTFLFVGVGLLLGLVGAGLLTAADVTQSIPSLGLFGRLLLLHGFMPALVLGVGGRLIPALLGFMPPPTQLATPQRGRGGVLVAVALLFIAGFPVEAFGWPVPGRLIQAVAVTIMALRFWQLHHWPKRTGVQPILLWLAGWCFVAGFWGYGIFPAYALQALHLMFIGGLGLTTFTVATRVVLSHGGFDMSAELTSKALFAAGVLMLLAMVMRVIAGIAAIDYVRALSIAAGLWLVALIIWSGRFLPHVGPRRRAAK